MIGSASGWESNVGGGWVKRSSAFMVLILLALCLIGFIGVALADEPLGECPKAGNWELVTVESLDISPETASGIPSLDNNDDGWTCIKTLPNFPVEGVFIFRDNSVQG
jgi:hypothetical protein